ncbi:MAG: tetratricopeptide repeat protein [Planctomycetes bacterium]|nr:tetratricopeptide repeat protein [Planctomycetota bacterium]
MHADTRAAATTTTGAPHATPLEQLPREVAELISTLRTAALAAPNDPRAHGALAFAYEASGLWPDAEATFVRALELAPRDPTLRLHRAIALENLDRDDEAVALLDALTREAPKFAPAHQRLGVACVRRGDLPRAEAAFRATLELAPREPHGHVGLAQVALANGDAAAALERLDHALVLAPNDKLAHYLRGTALLRLERVAEAEPELRLGANADVGYLRDAGAAEVERYAVGPTRTLDRALRALNGGKVAEAIALLEAQRTSDPTAQKILVTLGTAYARAGRVDDALAVFADAGRNDPRDPLVPINVAACEFDRGRYGECVAAADAALALRADLAPAHLVRGAALARLGRLDDALAALRRAATLDPKGQRARVELGRTAARAGDHRGAADAFADALRLAPNDFDALLGHASALRELGENDAANADFARAESLAQGDAARRDAVRAAREARSP